MSAASEYAELLKLIEVSGPFLSLPVFREVFPQGLIKDAPDLTRELRELYTEWRAARALIPHTVSPAQREWLRAVLLTLLEWPADLLVEDNAIPQNLSNFVAQHHETLRPDYVLLDDGKPRLLITLLPPAQQPDRRPPSTTWNATCATRMAELLHATRVPLGLVTNGERFTLVYAEPGQPTGFADFHAELWFDERLTLRAFRDFLGAGALFNRPPEQTLDALYRRSLENQQEVSTTLGRQVRRAVEMFVTALDRADRESGRALLQGLPGEHIYEAALTLMMRLVFLFFAEERDLLPITNPVYRENYAVSTLHDQLREAADRLGEEVLERRYDAFPRLLAGFRAVHGGIAHDLASLPAYGGDLFDPDRFPFLEGRAPGSDWRTAPAQPCPIHNRTVLHLLGALQFLEMKVPGGGRESRRLSFRALDIEQIGHVYEGLLDHTARRASEIVLGLDGKEELEVALSELNRRRPQADFVEWLADESGLSAKAIDKALAQTAVDDPLRWPEWEQVAKFAGLVRRDDNGDPCVFPAGSLYVTAGTARRQTGTQYTPRTLTESVVEHALAPLVYTGPAEGQPLEAWQLKPAGQILDLKICDFACGSAAFLVAAARYLSARLVEAWDAAQSKHGAGVQITPYGHPSNGLPEEELIPPDRDERGIYALRIAVERCLYGVDRNPLAVEMAKLSLWLLTLQRSRPFTFVDHAIRCGDSLLGVDLRQLSTWSLSGEGRQIVLFDDDLNFAADKREGLMKMQYRTDDQRRLLDAAMARTRRLRAAGDRLIATALEANPEASAAAVSMALEEQEAEARRILEGKRPFHWPVEFPEVFLHHGGFDAIVSNPPFIGSKYWASAVGEYLTQYANVLIGRNPGHSDICALFHRRAFSLTRQAGYTGLLGCDSLRDGDSYAAGLEHISERGNVYRARSSMPWPGSATVRICVVWVAKSPFAGTRILDEKKVESIDGHLNEADAAAGPFLLKGEMISGGGCHNARGESLVLTEGSDWYESLKRDGSPYLRLYVTGEDMNNHAFRQASRWCIYCGDSTLDAVEKKSPLTAQFLEEMVKPVRTPDYLRQFPGLQGRWWQFHRPAADLYREVSKHKECLVLAVVTKYVVPARIPSSWVCTNKLCVIAERRPDLYGLLTAQFFEDWVRLYSGSLGETLSLSLTRAVQTFPLPAESSDPTIELGNRIGLIYESVFDARRCGFTDLYNAVHNSLDKTSEIVALRGLRVQMDYAVSTAYGWTNVDLGHGFHQTRQGLRYTISESARRMVLDRLLTLNHERYAAGQSAAAAAPRPKAKARKRTPEQPDLF